VLIVFVFKVVLILIVYRNFDLREHNHSTQRALSDANDTSLNQLKFKELVFFDNTSTVAASAATHKHHF